MSNADVITMYTKYSSICKHDTSFRLSIENDTPLFLFLPIYQGASIKEVATFFMIFEYPPSPCLNRYSGANWKVDVYCFIAKVPTSDG